MSASSWEGRRRWGREKTPGGEEETVPWRKSGDGGEEKGDSDGVRERGKDKDILPLPYHRLEFTVPCPLHPNSPLRRCRLLLRATRASIAVSLFTTAPPPPPPGLSPPCRNMPRRAEETNGLENRVPSRGLGSRWKEGGHRRVALFLVNRQ